MKKILLAFLIGTSFCLQAQLNYTFSALSGTWIQNGNSGKTTLHNGSVDDAISSSTNIGFNFQFGCNTYTTFQASSNGVIFLGTTTAGSNSFNDLDFETDRPLIAPLWDDLATSNGGEVNCKLYGTAPNRYLVIEYREMEWYYFASAEALSFEIILYETTNRIEFVYKQINTGNISSPSASIGLGGATTGDFYSLNNTSAAPTPSQVTETSNLSVCPADNQVYRWDPVSCSGTPAGGTLTASSTNICSGLAVNMSVSGGSAGCGMTYQWSSAPASTGPWTNISGATSSTYTANPNSSTCYRRQVTCTASGLSATSNTVCVNVNPCIIMGTSTQNISCPSTLNFYDSGGPTSDYSSSETYTLTVTAPAGSCVSVTFNSFSTESCCDYIRIYDGASTAATQLGQWQGSSSPGTVTSTGNSLTFYWRSDGSFENPGWDAVISCLTMCSGTPLAGTASANPNSTCPTGYTANLALSGAAAGCGITYQWQSASASSGPWTNISGATTVSSTTTVNGLTYYRCIVTCSGSGQSVNSNTISATVSGGPANDNCATATSLTPNGTCVAGDVACASQSQAACVGTANDDVWYSFTATSTSHDLQLTASSSFDPVVQVFSGSCGSLTSMSCTDAGFTSGSTGCSTMTGLTIGQTYYIRVYDYYSGMPSTTTFTICVGSGAAYTCNLNYSNSTITYSWESSASLTSTLNMSDDILHSAKTPIGFNFCFDGFLYTDFYIASNASMVFDAVGCNPNIQSTDYASPSEWTGYTISAAAPVTGTSIPRNAILGPWHDIEPLTSSATDDIRYATLGTAPNRRFVLQFGNIRMYSGTCNSNTSLNFYGQIKIYETTNNIEVHLQSKQLCTTWNSGAAVLGLHNYNGTLANVPAGYNYPTQWTASNQAWRWTTSCATCVVLPTGMEEFKGEKFDQTSNELRWKTITEENVSHYILERARDGVNFAEVANVKTNGNPVNYYQVHDAIPDNKTYYYRVRTIKSNGDENTSGIVAIDRTLVMPVTVSTVYPNPSEGNINVDLDIYEKGDVRLELYDVVGKKVAEKTVSTEIGFNTVQLDFSHVARGLYYLKVYSNNNLQVFSEKVIKE